MRKRSSLTRLALTATATGVLALGVPAVALAAATVPVAASQGSADADASAGPSQSQWNQLNQIATTHPVLGVTGSGTVLRLAAGTSAEEKAKVEALIPAGTPTAVRTSRFSDAELGRIQKTVTARDWNSDADKYGVATSYDAATDKVVVYTNAPGSVTKPLSEAYPGAVEVQQSRIEPQNSRFADAQPFWGGAALVGSNHGKCTAGFTVRDRVTRHLYMTTAGHCYGNLTHVYNRRLNDSGGNWVGQVSHRDQSLDIELMQGNTSLSYGTDIFTGGSTSSESHEFVHGTEAPSLGKQVCVSGSVSLNHCGHPITDTHFSICYTGTANCITNGRGFLYDRGGTWPTYDNGRVTEGGDSGAPIFTSDHTGSAAWIVGSHSGLIWRSDGACGCTKPHMIGVNVYEIVRSMRVDVVTK
ncbi:hypothetical protein ACFWM5_38170 [Streptomyces bobili]|uniref:hypothetical protein n=1 Tax=Streptomyces bobili TaxID=67280 RepID=UPI003663F30E